MASKGSQPHKEEAGQREGKGQEVRLQEEKIENLKYEVAQEMGLENKDQIKPPGERE